MSASSYPVLLRDPDLPERIYVGRADLLPGEVTFVCDDGGAGMCRSVPAAELASARRSPRRLRGMAAAELILTSGRRVELAVLMTGGLAQLLDALAGLGGA